MPRPDRVHLDVRGSCCIATTHNLELAARRVKHSEMRHRRRSRGHFLRLDDIMSLAHSQRHQLLRHHLSSWTSALGWRKHQLRSRRRTACSCGGTRMPVGLRVRVPTTLSDRLSDTLCHGRMTCSCMYNLDKISVTAIFSLLFVPTAVQTVHQPERIGRPRGQTRRASEHPMPSRTRARRVSP